MRVLVLGLLLLLPVAVWGADKQYSDVRAYFPMVKGKTWVYGGADKNPFWMTSITDCEAESNSKKNSCLFVHEINFGANIRNIEVLSYFGNSVTVVAKGNDFDPVSPMEIKLQSPLKVGKTWEYFKEGHKTKVQLTILKILPKMTVVAGTFKKVLKVEEITFTKKEDDIWHRWPEETSSENLYYAPNTGLIKQEFVNNSTFTYRELISYE